MKNFNKLFSGILLAFGLMTVLSLNSKASVVARMPKETYVLSYTTTLSTVTPTISTSAVGNAAFMPGAVYQVVQASGAASEFFAMYDSTGTVQVTCGNPSTGTGATILTARMLFGSTTANTVTTFDPPLQFHNGLIVCDSAATGQTAVTYELGRGLNGQ